MICKIGHSVSLGKGLLKISSLAYRGMVNDKVFCIITLGTGNAPLYFPKDISIIELPIIGKYRVLRVTPEEFEFEKIK